MPHLHVCMYTVIIVNWHVYSGPSFQGEITHLCLWPYMCCSAFTHIQVSVYVPAGVSFYLPMYLSVYVCVYVCMICSWPHFQLKSCLHSSFHHHLTFGSITIFFVLKSFSRTTHANTHTHTSINARTHTPTSIFPNPNTYSTSLKRDIITVVQWKLDWWK